MTANFIILLTLLVASALVVSGARLQGDYWLYTNGALQNGYQDWSWAKVHSLSNTTRSHSGASASISWDPNDYDAIYLHSGSSGVQFAGYLGLQFWVYATGSNTDFNVVINQATAGPSALLSQLIPKTGPKFAVPTNTWVKAIMSFAEYPVTPSGDSLIQIWFQAGSGASSTVFIDDISLISSLPPPPPTPPPNWDDGPIVGNVQVSLQYSQTGPQISPLIYGVNFATDFGLSNAKYTANRNGGNAASRFNWEKSIHNTASDWFFFNIAEAVKNESALPEGNSVDAFLDSTKLANPSTRSLITLNLIGYAPLDDRTIKPYSYSIQKYGPQTNSECQQAGNASWCTKDAGNGISSATNSRILGADIWRTTSKIVDNSYNIAFLDHLTKRGTYPDFVLLDNEPMLWSATHFDVFPNGLTYDDLWNRTQTASTGIKQKYPNTKILGPAVWGWCAYFYSAADGCSCGADCKSHGSLPLLEYYLQQNCKNSRSPSELLVDYLDIHYYPQASGVTSNDESPTSLQHRMNAGKSLYSSGYVDESWINQQIFLLPRMKAIIAQHCPAVKLSISEYSFGDDDIPSAALANAEALAIFGREGVEIACKWVAPAPHTRTENAFKLFTNFDNAGSSVINGAISLPGNSSNIDATTIYGIYSTSSKSLFVLLFNKDPGTGRISVAGQISGISGNKVAKRFSFGKASSDVVQRDPVTITDGKFSLVLSIFEATVLQIQL